MKHVTKLKAYQNDITKRCYITFIIFEKIYFFHISSMTSEVDIFPFEIEIILNSLVKFIQILYTMILKFCELIIKCLK